MPHLQIIYLINASNIIKNNLFTVYSLSGQRNLVLNIDNFLLWSFWHFICYIPLALNANMF